MTARSRAAIRVKRAIRHMSPRHIAKTQLTKRAITNFAEKVGLVYFGFVDQRDEDRRLVRGHTVSATHIDNHYCIGTVHGYDVVLLLRNDVVRMASGKQQRCHWLIYTIDLKSPVDVPHFYIGHQNREHIFAETYAQLKHVSLGALSTYPAQFDAHYSVYSQPAHAIDVERIITPDTAAVIASHFQGASIEVENSTVYVYVESEHPREATLEKMLSNGLWLAEQIDERLSRTVLRPRE